MEPGVEQEQVVEMVVVEQEQDKMVGVEQLDLARTGSISPTSTSDSTEVDSSSCSTAAAAGTFKIDCRYSGKKQIVAISLNAILIEICVSPIGNLVAWESERKTRPGENTFSSNVSPAYAVVYGCHLALFVVKVASF